MRVGQRVKLKESENKDKYFDLDWELKKTKEYLSNSDTNCKWRALYIHQRISTGTGGLAKKRTSGDYPNYYIVKIGQNTMKRRLTVIQTHVRNHQLTLVWKTHTKKNDTHKLLWEFDIHTDHLISARRPDLIIINKKNWELGKLSTFLSRLTTE